MLTLYLLLDFSVWVMALWTVVFHLTVWAGQPTGVTVATFLIATVCWLIVRLRKTRKSKRPVPWKPLLALSTACVLFTMLVSRPDADDLAIFHPAIEQARHLSEQLPIRDTYHNYPGLPAISLLHAITSYEYLAGSLGRISGLGELNFYHNVIPLFWAAIYPLALFVLNLQLGFKMRASVLATAFSLLFVIYDGGEHLSFGNYGLARIFQGKAILCAIWVPLLLISHVRFLRRPSRRHFCEALLVAIGSVGLNNSALFLTPTLLAASALTYLALHPKAIRRRWPRLIALGVTGIYPVLFALAQILRIFPMPTETINWTHGWPANWWTNLGIVWGYNLGAARTLFIVGLAIAVQRGRYFASWFSRYFLSLVLLFANPLSAKFWMKHILAGSYWRFVYLLILPSVFGIAVVGLARKFKLSPRVAWVGAISLLAVMVGCYRGTILSAKNGVYFKSPTELRFPPPERDFSLKAAELVAGKSLLAPDTIAVPIALVSPTVRLEASQYGNTLHKFSILGDKDQGLSRNAAQGVIAVGTFEEPYLTHFSKSIDRGVNAIVTRNQYVDGVQKLLKTPWKLALQSDGYTLLIKER